MPDVVVVGSVNADLVVRAARLPGPGETVTGGTFARHGGGKGANQAVAAARLGARTALVAAVGDDDFGAEALRGLPPRASTSTRVARLDGRRDRRRADRGRRARGEPDRRRLGRQRGARRRVRGRRPRAARGGVVLLSLEVGDEALLAGARGRPPRRPQPRAGARGARRAARRRPAAHPERRRGARPHRRGGRPGAALPCASARARPSSSRSARTARCSPTDRATRAHSRAAGRRRRHHGRRRLPERRAGRGARRAAWRSRTRWPSPSAPRRCRRCGGARAKGCRPGRRWTAG